MVCRQNAVKFKIAGVTGRSPDKVNNFAQQFETYAYPSISAMYDATKADIVVTAVNEASSLDVSLECLNQPWACLFEKPVGQVFVRG